MHLPELALSCSRFRGLRRSQSPRMNTYEREVAVDKSHAAEQFTKHLFSGAMSAMTTRATLVAVGNYGNRSLSRPNHVVAFVDRNWQHERLWFDHPRSPSKKFAPALYFFTKLIFVPYLRPTPL